MRTLRTTPRFRRDVKRVLQKGRDLHLLRTTIDRLAADEPLPDSVHSRVLTGRWQGVLLCRLPGTGHLLCETTPTEVVLIRLVAPGLLSHLHLALLHLRDPRHLGHNAALLPAMFKNYLVTTLRSLRKQAGYASINVFGLAVGLAACLLMLLYVQDELDFDEQHRNRDRIVQVAERRVGPDGNERRISATAGAVAGALVATYPDVETATRIGGQWMSGRLTIRHDDVNLYLGDHLFVEPSFFDVFDIPLLSGNTETAVSAPRTVVLTESLAETLFGNADPVGRTFEIPELGEMTVTGLTPDARKDTHLAYSMLIAFESLRHFPWVAPDLDGWESDDVGTYALLRPGASRDDLDVARLVADRAAEATTARSVYLRTLSEVHFENAEMDAEFSANPGNRTYLWLFSTLAFVIVGIACINYVNLATARSMRRAREVGLRKAVGAHRTQLVGQFLTESLVLTSLALVLALVLVALALPGFNALADKQLALDLTGNVALGLGLLVLLVCVGVLGGSYPALYLSRYQPAAVLKGRLPSVARGGRMVRSGLVVMQFALSVGLVVATLVVLRQMDYVQDRALGFEDAHLVAVDINSGQMRRQFEAVRAEMEASPYVQRVSASSRVPGEWKSLQQVEAYDAEGDPQAVSTMYFFGVDEQFVDTFGMPLVAGRTFDPAMATDTAAVIINQAAVRALGWTDAVGRELVMPARASGGRRVYETPYRATVIGVVEDFHFQSLHTAVESAVMGHWNNPVRALDYFTARIAPDAVPEALAHLGAVHDRFDGSRPMEYNFLTERLTDFYASEHRVATVVGVAAGLALLIACLGLFGLAAFITSQRTKEIGVRKALGAGVPSLVRLLTFDFLRLVGLAVVVALPVAFLLMRGWLASFAYHPGVGWVPLVGGAALALAVAVLTVGHQTIRAARMNSVEALRYE